MLRTSALVNTGLIIRVLLSTNLLALRVPMLAGLNLLVSCVPLEEEMEHPDTAPSKTEQKQKGACCPFCFSETAPLFCQKCKCRCGAPSNPSKMKGVT